MNSKLVTCNSSLSKPDIHDGPIVQVTINFSSFNVFFDIDTVVFSSRKKEILFLGLSHKF